MFGELSLLLQVKKNSVKNRKKVILCRRWSTGICYVNDHRNLLPPLLLDFLNVFNADGTASPGAERARLFPGWAFPWDYQRLTGKEEKRSGTMPKYFQYLV